MTRFARMIGMAVALAAPAFSSTDPACPPDTPCPTPSPPDYHALRMKAEAEIRTMLIDPSSAQFEWPSGFVYGSWKPTVFPHQTGFLICGKVNGKNRYGGYIGAKWFSVILQGDKTMLASIDKIGGIAQAEHYCAHRDLPPPQPGILETAAPAAAAGPAPFSVADELAKLAALRDKGVITPREFEAEKAKLLHRP